VKGSELLFAAENGGDRAPRDTRFAGSRNGRSNVLVDEISGRIPRTSELFEVGQGQRVEDVEIVSAGSHGQIFAPTWWRRYPRGYGGCWRMAA
jgi:hypothetical protein